MIIILRILKGVETRGSYDTIFVSHSSRGFGEACNTSNKFKVASRSKNRETLGRGKHTPVCRRCPFYVRS